jgi:ribosomal protein L7/L12
VEYPEEPEGGASRQVVDLARRGKRMQAIKLHMQETGVGLRVAKEFVDSLT